MINLILTMQHNNKLFSLFLMRFAAVSGAAAAAAAASEQAAWTSTSIASQECIGRSPE